jgi:L-cysteate sulfo-lyase
MNGLPRPRFSLGHFPTPVQPLPRLSRLLGGPQIFIKRDDCTGLAFGGNKTRKLEFLIGEAQEGGADTVITAGAAQSNHCRQTAAAAVRAGMECHLVLGGEAPGSAAPDGADSTLSDPPTGNLFLDRLLGAEIHWSGVQRRGEAIDEIAEALRSQGRKPYVIPYGGSNAIGALGYVEAMQEFAIQSHQLDLEPDAMVFASSSGGTHAGMIAGAARTGYRGRIVGIGIDKEGRAEGSFAAGIGELVRETRDLAGVSAPAVSPLPPVLLREEFASPGYGVITDAEREAISLLARGEAILLDPVYTGRAMAGLISMIRNGEFGRNERVLFWHTGGGPSLLASSRGLQGP